MNPAAVTFPSEVRNFLRSYPMDVPDRLFPETDRQFVCKKPCLSARAAMP